MAKLYECIAQSPGRFILAYVLFLAVLWAVPTLFVFRAPPWDQSGRWAGTVLQFGGLLLVLVGGVVPISRWHDERVKAITEQKPIVFTDCLPDGTHEMRNIGTAPAINVWLVLPSLAAPISLGSLDAHQGRPLAQSVAATLDGSPMIAAIYAARARSRPASPTKPNRSPARSSTRASTPARKGWTVDEHVYVDDGISGAEFAGAPGSCG
jgi:hypothetical protein